MKTYNIVLLGSSGSGKTTFLANLYDFYIKKDRSERYEFFEKGKGTMPYLAKIHEEYLKKGGCESTTKEKSLLFEIKDLPKDQQMGLKITDIPGDEDEEHLTAEGLKEQDMVLFFINCEEKNEDYKRNAIQKVKQVKAIGKPVLLIFSNMDKTDADAKMFITEHYKRVSDFDRIMLSKVLKGNEIESVVHKILDKVPETSKEQKERKNKVLSEVLEATGEGEQTSKKRKILTFSIVSLICLVALVLLIILSQNKPSESFYTITIEQTEGGKVTLTPQKEKYEKDEIVTLKAIPTGNNEFKEWSGDITGNDETKEITITEDLSVKAKFEEYFSIVLVKSTGGNVTVTPEKDKYIKGELITLTAQPALLYDFVGWTGDLSVKNETTKFYITKTMFVGADFEKIANEKTYEVKTRIIPGSGKIVVIPKKEQYQENEQITVYAEPDNGWKFKNWGGDLSGTTRMRTITVTKELNITAYFQKK